MKQLIIIQLLSCFCLGQAPQIDWQKSLGGVNDDEAYSIQQTTDGGYIVAGNTSSNDGDVTVNNGGTDCWVAKLDASGNLSWEKSFGGSGWEIAYSIQQTVDGGYIFVGWTSSNDGDIIGNHGQSDYWVIKLDASGNLSWQKALGGTVSEYAYSIQQTTDGGYIVAGSTYSNDGDVTVNNGTLDYWIIKLDASGNITWEKSYGGSSWEYANSIQQTTDGGYIVAGTSHSNDIDVTVNNGASDMWIVKLDASGTITWEKSFGGSINETAYSIQQTIDGGYIAAGANNSIDGDVTGNHGGYDFWVVKLDTSGNLSWQRSLGGSYDDQANSVQQTTDGGYIVAGYSISNDGDVTGNNNNGLKDYWVVKLDTLGNISWQKSLGGSNDDRIYSVQQTTDGGCILAGYSASTDGDITAYNGGNDFWVVKLASFSSIEELTPEDKSLVMIVDLLGRETDDKPNTTLIYIYSDGTTEKVFRME